MDDSHLLCAKLPREALLRCSSAAGRSFQGLSVAARHLQLPSGWKRRAREIDATLGHVEK